MTQPPRVRKVPRAAAAPTGRSGQHLRRVHRGTPHPSWIPSGNFSVCRHGCLEFVFRGWRIVCGPHRPDYELRRESTRVLDVGTAQQPGRRNPLTGNQARKDLIESEPPEREKRSGNAKLEPERHRGNRTRKSLIESETRNTEGKRPEESPRG